MALAAPAELAPAARRAIEAPATVVLVSPASIYEITLTVALGKIPAPSADVPAAVEATGFTELPIRSAHAALAGRLPLHHRDPFDRLLIAQGLLEGVAIVTRDRHVEAYGVETVVC